MKCQKKIIIAIVLVLVSSSILIALALCCMWICRRKKPRFLLSRNKTNIDSESGLALAPFLGRYSSLRALSLRGLVSFIEYKSIEEGTENFHTKNLLGKGGFGRVYKVKLNDGSKAAVKKLDCSSLIAQREFENEVAVLSQLDNENIISFIGYSIDCKASYIVCELMSNGSLEHQLHGPTQGSALTWPIRLKIALDIAKGLEYLHRRHDPPVIHRDLKSSNILLDCNFNAKLADFGVATIVIDGQEGNIIEQPRGTIGYIAPEYVSTGTSTDKSDIYSFGVILMELLSRKKPVDIIGMRIGSLANKLLSKMEVMKEILDPMISNEVETIYLQKITLITDLCLNHDPTFRPNIDDIIDTLVPLVLLHQR